VLLCRQSVAAARGLPCLAVIRTMAGLVGHLEIDSSILLLI